MTEDKKGSSNNPLTRRRLLVSSAAAIGAVGLGYYIYDRSSDTPESESLIIPRSVSELAGKEFISSYGEWKAMYLVTDFESRINKIEHTIGMRDSSSEVTGYGMIFAVHAKDRETFDKIWNFAKSHLNEDGLMQFHIGADNKPINKSSAADADLDIAYALYAADKTWGRYEEDAKSMMNRILGHDVEEGTFVLKGGNDWGGSDETNPSYYSPFYYALFEKYTGDERWGKVARAGREVLDNIEENGNNGTDLPPNWSKADGTPNESRDDATHYSHEAIRVPLRQGMLALYGCEDPHAINSAVGQLEDVNDFVKTIDPGDIPEGFDENGEPINEWNNNPAFAGTFAIASLVGDNPELTLALVENTIDWRSKDWVTNEGVRNFSLLVLSGKMIH